MTLLAPVGFGAALVAGTAWAPLSAVAIVSVLLLAHELLTVWRYGLRPDPGVIGVAFFFLASAAAGALAARPRLARAGRRKRPQA
ncbi:MAG: hypothetical protein ACM3RP_09995 [Chitinophagales bacterium]